MSRKTKKWKNWKEGSRGTAPQLGEKRAENRLIVVLTDEQKELITEAVEAANKALGDNPYHISLSAWARNILLKEAEKVRKS